MSKAKSKTDKPAKAKPYNFEERRIERATEFCKAKADGGQMPPRIKLTRDGPNGKVQSEANHSDSTGHLFSMHQAFGTGSNDFYNQQLGWVLAVMRRRGHDLPDDIEANAGIAAVAAVEPQNEVEAMLAVQMAGTHEVAMDMLSRARRTDNIDHLERYGTLATKLLRTYSTQLEALAKMRRGGAQKVTVEHVHVHEGGQAIVGNVNTGGGRGNRETRHQPYEPTDPRALAFAPVDPLLREDAARDAVPGTRDEGEEAVPHSRRRAR